MTLKTSSLLGGACLLLAVSASNAQVQPPAALEQSILHGAPGQVIQLGSYAPPFSAILNPFQNQLEPVPGGLFYSDCPEYVPGFGIMYQGTFEPGPVRVYLYHVNEASPPANMRVTAVLENLGGEKATVTFQRKSLPPYSANYLAVGREAGVLFYQEDGPLPPDLVIPPGGAAVLDPDLDGRALSRNQLVSAKYDMTADQSLRVTSLSVPLGTDTLEQLAGAQELPNDDQLRQGSFPHWGKRNAGPYTIRTSAGTRRLRVADGSFFLNDPPVSGTDEQRGVPTELAGNFGVTYDVEFLVEHDDGRRLALLVNPRGGGYGGYFRFTYPDGGTPGGQLAPSPALNVLNSSEAAIIAKLPLQRGVTPLRLEFIPAGASNLPIEVLLIPFDDPGAEFPEEPLPEGWGLY